MGQAPWSVEQAIDWFVEWLCSWSCSGRSAVFLHIPREQRGPRSLADVQCFNCSQFGHMIRNCPEPRKQKANAGPAASASAASGNNKGNANATGEPKVMAQQRASAVLGANRFAPLGQLTEQPKWNCAFTVKAGTAVKVEPSVEQSMERPNNKARRVRRARRIAKKKLVVVAAASSEKPLDKQLADSSWGMDSMASLHVSGNRALFTSGIKQCSPMPIQVADGSFVTATYIGDVLLNVTTAKGEVVTLPIQGVHFHERFSANLLSWNTLGDAGWEFHSTKKGTFVLTPGRRHKVMLNTRGGVSVIDSKTPQDCVYALGASVSANATSLVRLHETLGHMGFDRMMRLIKAESTLDLPKIGATDGEIQEARRLVLDCKSLHPGQGHPYGLRSSWCRQGPRSR